EIGGSSLTGLELVQETTDKVVLVKEKTNAVPLDEIEADKTLHFVEETMGIMDHEI
nr:hypothetical protein [Tanacetum cinerariifolium]